MYVYPKFDKQIRASSFELLLVNEAGTAGATVSPMGKPGEGLRHYYLSHIHDLLLQLRVKTHNLRRLEAQRNDLNSKGRSTSSTVHSSLLI